MAANLLIPGVRTEIRCTYLETIMAKVWCVKRVWLTQSFCTVPHYHQGNRDASVVKTNRFVEAKLFITK